MNRVGHDNVKFFVGPEVEHTPASTRKTLFVVGQQPLTEILLHVDQVKVSHVFLGANHSFDAGYVSGADTYWKDTIAALINKNVMVTLEYPAHQHQCILSILGQEIFESRNFVPLLSVRIPNFETSGPNLTVKIDDVDFQSTNRGVWCHSVKDLTDSNKFTDWQEYIGDEPIITQQSKEDKTMLTPETMKQALETLDKLGATVTNKPEVDTTPDTTTTEPESVTEPVLTDAVDSVTTDAAEPTAGAVTTDAAEPKKASKKAAKNGE